MSFSIPLDDYRSITFSCDDEVSLFMQALIKDGERYRLLRNREPADVLTQRGTRAGCWIDCEADDGTLILLTGNDADETIDAMQLAAQIAKRLKT